MSLSKKTAVHLSLIVLLGIACYSGTFHVPFVFDDLDSIKENQIIQHLDNFLSSAAGYDRYPQRYIGYLSFALNYRLCSLNVVCYHAVNLAIHIANALLLYMLVILTFRTDHLKDSSLAGPAKWVALFAAALFVVHPVETQAVTYIVQRLASLAVFFYLGSFVLFIKARISLGQDDVSKKTTVTLYLFSLVFAILAMKTKEISFTLPLMAALYELFFFDGRRRKRFLFLLPMLLTLVVIPASMLDLQKPLGEILSDVGKTTRLDNTTIPHWDYFITQLSVIVTYIRLIFFPVNQNLDYYYPVYHSLFDVRTFGSLLLLTGLLAWAVWMFRRSRIGGNADLRLVSFGIFWFFITLLVESSVISIPDVIFEHRVYLPSIGAFIAVSCAFWMVSRNRLKSSRIPLLTSTSIVLIFMIATFSRNTVWSSEMNLWQDVVSKSPNKSRPHVNLGEAYLNKKMVDKGIEEFQTAVKLKPTNVPAHYNLGLSYLKKGRTSEAINEFRSVLELEPDNTKAMNNLGNIYKSIGLFDDAIAQYREASRLDPEDPLIHLNLGLAYRRKGLYAEAIWELEIAVRLKPDDAGIRNSLGVAYAEAGMAGKAVEEFQHAVSLKPGDRKFQNNLERAQRSSADKR